MRTIVPVIGGRCHALAMTRRLWRLIRTAAVMHVIANDDNGGPKDKSKTTY